ncbi:MAG: threonine synthase [Chloroflexi bacterium]|nr:threonine synthase [Chloroflexota bacterium]HCU74021.1 threonine synthase [Chloroflexota bacterium]|tara:strand:- start:1839 stop:3095 length:1257 start_codon:yes stop_codon:yes gene_type:complete
MSSTQTLRCRECARTYPLQASHICEFDFGPLEIQFDYKAISKTISREKISERPPTLWRYHELLPVDSGWDETWPVGFTPLQRAHNLGDRLGLSNLYIKNDTVNPTYSFKDRVVAVAITKAREFGFNTFACASTGNLAGAVSAAGARHGMPSYVFMPADLEIGKVRGAAVYGANIVAVDGTYDELNRLCSEIADLYSWAFCNINIRPYYAEGSKTLAFESVEQLGWQAPDHIVAPIASGSLYTKVGKAMRELVDVGLLEKQSTRVHGAQAAGCGPVAEAFSRGQMTYRPVRTPSTVAKSLAIGNPADGFYSLKLAKEVDGLIESVTDDEIVAAMQLLASTEGVFAETAAGVTIAVLVKLAERGVISRDDVTVALVTGNGLKTQEAIDNRVNDRIEIQPSIASFQENLAEHGVLTPAETI